ncbi:MAG: hypothetical protein U9O78_04030 [Patescibacteria group bacterium]|nr:hypothetical protein [Patescibacteria group bacterium]
MTIKDITTSLELAKQLKEAGYPQESLFYWVVSESKHLKSSFHNWKKQLNEDYLRESGKWIWYKTTKIYTNFDENIPVQGDRCNIIGKYSAPTCAELGEVLPKVCYSFKPLNSTKPWICYWQVEGGIKYKPHQLKRLSIGGTSEANVRTKMYLYLKKEDLL